MPAESSEKSSGPFDVFQQELVDSADLLEEEPERIFDLLEKLEGELDEEGLEDEKESVKELRRRGLELSGGASDAERVLEDVVQESLLTDELKSKVMKLLLFAARSANETAQEQIDQEF